MKLSAEISPEARQHLEQAYTLKDKGDFEAALRECDIVLASHLLFAEAHNLRGLILEELRRPAEALKSYEKAVMLNPQDDEAARNLTELKSEIAAATRLNVELSTFFKVVGGGMTLFAVGMGILLLRMMIEFQNWAPIVLILGGGAVGFILWSQTGLWPRSIDEEGITRRDGQRVLWKDLTKVERITSKVNGIRVAGAIRLHFQGEETVEIAPNSISPSGQVVQYIARKTNAWPG